MDGEVPDPDVLEALLDEGERARAHRFRFQHLTHEFIVRRAALRVLLGSYLNEKPERIRYRFGPNGKPELAGMENLQFNVSGSGQLAAFAFTQGCALGVDVEQMREFPDLDGVAKRFFSSEEAAELLSLPLGEREAAFFLCWTRKEAYVKAHGDGLSIALDSFQVTLRANEAARLVQIGGDEAAAKAWSIENLNPFPGYAGALAYRDSHRPLLQQPLLVAADIVAAFARR